MRDDDDRFEWAPWHIAIGLAIIGVVGAVAVTFAARAIHEIDRKDIQRWEAFLLPKIAEARGEQATVVALAARATTGASEAELDGEMREVRKRLQALRRPLQEYDYPRVTLPATGHYLTAYGYTFDALATLENALTADSWDADARTRFDASIEKATEAYAEGERLRMRLRARARLDRP